MRKGFTLIELLVVMAIISILASILFPVFNRAIEKAKATSCLSNVKQLQLATMMYCQDYDGAYPPAPYVDVNGKTVAWFDDLQPYTENKQILACPTLSGPPVGYGMNWWMTGSGGANAHKSSEKITYADATKQPDVAWYIFPKDGTDPGPGGSNPDPRHSEGANFAFADGHAKWQKITAASVADFAAAWDPNQ
ncbi:MAG TPA: prepilin-type N-terminal cleavage/methylation domain-containing protein [Armatimonadota bacterium]|jgi:prepilin-type N-terminal cleavage/methylation domain-containing protein/prepilin-type processing-associated H-X9-DG protein